MPYATNDAMPAGVRKGLSAKEQSQWRAIFNSCHAKHPDDEAMCYKMANGTVKGKKEREAAESDGAEVEATGEIREVVAADGTKDYQYVDSWDYASRAYSQQEAGYNPVGGGSDKACSNCRFFISPARCAVVSGDIAPNGVSDMWDAVPDYTPEPIQVVVVGVASADDGADAAIDEGEKMARAKMPTSDFAYVDKEGGKHLPIHDAAHVRNALARFDQTQFESDSAKNAARTKILAAAKRFGVDASSKDNGLRPTGATAEEESLIARVTSRILEGIKSLLTPATPKAPVHAGGGDSDGAVRGGAGFSLVRDQKSGRYRFMAVMTNNFVDHHGEVFTEAAHQEYVDWAEKSGEYPELWLWHTPGSRIGQADWLDYSNGFVVASGLVDQSKELVAEKLAQQEDVGVSHGFVCLKQKDGTIVKYRSYELSPLPIASAANEWTSFDLLGLKENEMPFNEKRREWLTKLVGEDTVKSWEKDTDNLSTTLKELGVEFKSKMETEVAAGEAEKAESDAATLAGEVRTLVGTVGALTTAVAGFKGELEAAKVESKKSREDILAEELKARTNPTAQNGYRASASESTVVAGEKAKPEVAWFDSVVMGVKAGADGVGAAAQ